MTAKSDPMPKGLLARATWAAENTPEKRNRAVDLYRAVAILFVVLGHWLLVAPVIRGGEVELTILLAEQRWTQYATWLFQVMPVFFFVGGYANSLSWNSARNDPIRKRAWAAGRLSRLLVPTMPLVLVWAAGAFIARRAGISPDLIAAASQAALVPIWFLAVYIIITVAVPVSVKVWDALGLWSVLILAAAAIAVDALGFGAGLGWLRWVNYAFVWLAVHQLGYWWHTSDRINAAGLALIALGIVWLGLLIGPLGYPVSMVSVPGDAVSNTRPPTTAMLAIGAIQIGIILLLEAPVSRWLANTRPWARVILLNQMIMSVYLWHITALIALVGILMLLGGIGLSVTPGTAGWWLARPLWVVLLIATLAPILAIFMRFEAAPPTPPERAPGPARALIGALVTCAGLIAIALQGIGSGNALGINVIAVALVVVGVTVATRPTGPTGAST